MVALSFTSNKAVASKSGNIGSTTPYPDICRGSLLNLESSQQLYMSLDELKESTDLPVYATSSTTCSRRCSQRCSQTCTTTRGCSSRCKTYTEGCSGAGTPEDPDARRTGFEPAFKGLPRSPNQPIGIRDFQYLLVVAGYDVALSGKFDDKTKAAITDFKTKNSLTPADTLDQLTWHAMCLALYGLYK